MGCAAIALLLAFTLPSAAQRVGKSEAPPEPVAIEIQSEPVTAFDHRDPSQRRFGALEFRGGLILTSRFREFGGISALNMAPNGADFVSLTDQGWWLRGRITYSGTRPSGITAAEMAPMLGTDGRTLASRRWYDTESIARDGDTLYVGIERVHQIVRFNFGKDGLKARGQPIDVPAAFRTMPRNGGIEALAFVPRGAPLGGTLIAISERAHDRDGDHLAFMIGGPRPGQFTIKRLSGYDISDAAMLSSSELLILERKFGWTTGLFIRIRRLPISQLQPGAVLDGRVLLEADLGQQIDNMEGLGVHRSGSEVVLTLISDNNFSALQRNLLLQFTLAEL
jgi:hypothetical protein